MPSPPLRRQQFARVAGDWTGFSENRPPRQAAGRSHQMSRVKCAGRVASLPARGALGYDREPNGAGFVTL